jgi:ABC-type sugar transport system ATPase subunit
MLELRAIERRYRSELVLAGVDLDVRRGEIVALIGPSGAGKSTLLRIIAGLDRADRGSIRLGGRDISALPPAARRVAMTFDDGALYEHLTVIENLAVGLEQFGFRGAAVGQAATEAAALVGASELLGHRPAMLSAGQRRRVALARAIARRPDVLLLDEPLTHLDLRSRLDLREDLRRVHEATGAATLLVTHDHADALAIADRLAYLDAGRMLHVGTAESFGRPAHVAVARGCSWHPMNVLPDPEGNGWLALPASAVTIARLETPSHAETTGTERLPSVGEVLFLSGDHGPLRRTEGDENGVVVTVGLQVARSSQESAPTVRLRCLLPRGLVLAVGDAVRVRLSLDQLQSFDRQGLAVAQAISGHQPPHRS